MKYEVIRVKLAITDDNFDLECRVCGTEYILDRKNDGSEILVSSGTNGVFCSACESFTDPILVKAAKELSELFKR